MANLSFMSELTDEQRQYAEIIRSKAQEMGIPPELAVAVAYQESRLNPRSASSSAGAMGIMQVRPIAAREVGVDPNKLQDPATNIDAGLRYLKKALDETGDTRVAIIYYNAGPGRLAEIERTQKLPEETEKYLRSLKSYGAFNAPEPAQQVTQAAPDESTAAPDSFAADLAGVAERVAQGANAQERRMAELVGLGAGATVSALRAAPGAIRATRQALGQGAAAGAPGAAGAPPALPAAGAAPAGALGGGSAAPAGLGAPTAASPAGQVAPAVATQPTGGMPTAAQAARVSAGTTGDLGTTGRQRMVGFNEQTAQQAARAKSAEQMFAQLAQRGAVPMTTPQVLAEMPDLTTSAGGILVSKQSIAEPIEAKPPQSPLERLQQARETQRAARASQAASIVGRRATPLSPAVVPPAPVQGMLPVSPPPKPSGLEQITQMFSQAARSGLEAIKPALAFGQRYIAPPLALAQGAGELVSAKQSMDRGDPLGAGLKGLGGAGAIASMFTPAALPVAVGAPLAQAFRERMAENRQQFPPDTRPLTPEEEEMASRPALFYRSGWRRPAMNR